jgi:anti-anti-sigma factor
MELVVQNESEGKVVALSGRITSRDYESFKQLLALFDEGGIPRIVFDFSNVDFLDSTALGMVLMVRDKAQAKGVAFSMRGIKGQVKRLMDVVKLSQLVQ